SLNAGDRKIITYFEHKSIRSIVQNSFIAKQIAKLTLVNEIDDALETESNVLIINLEEKKWDQLDGKIKNTVALLILLKDSTILSEGIAIRSNFNAILESKELIVLKRIK